VAPSLGGVESLVTRCALTTHRDLGLAGRQVRPAASALDLVHGYYDSHHQKDLGQAGHQVCHGKCALGSVLDSAH